MTSQRLVDLYDDLMADVPSGVQVLTLHDESGSGYRSTSGSVMIGVSTIRQHRQPGGGWELWQPEGLVAAIGRRSTMWIGAPFG